MSCTNVQTSVVAGLAFHLLLLVPKITTYLNFAPSHTLLLATSKQLCFVSNILQTMAIYARPPVDEWVVFLGILEYFAEIR